MKCFSIYSNQIKKRFDPKFLITSLLLQENKSDKITYKKLSEFLLTPPQYGANEVAVDWSENSVYRYIRITDIDECGNLKNNDIKTASYVDTRYELEENDILFARSGATAGKCLIYKKDYGKAIFAGYLIRFKINPQKLNPMFLFYYTQTKYYKDWVESIQRPAGQPNINSKEFCSLEIPVFSDDDEENLKIQENIISIMEQAYTLKTQYEEEANDLLATINDVVLNGLGIKYSKNVNYKSYSINSMHMKNSRIDSYYHQPKFEEVKENIINSKYKTVSLLTLLADVISGQRPQGGVSQIKEGIPSIGGEHILSDGSIETENLKYIPIDFHNAHLNSKVNVLDVLMVKDGATTGKIGIIPKNYPYNDANINEHVFILRTKPGVNPYYIFAYLKSEIGQIQIQREITGGTIMGIIKDSLKNILIPYEKTNFNIQDEIANEYISNINKAKQLQDKAIKEFKQAKIKIEKMILGEE